MEQECYSCDWSEKPYIKISTLASAASRKSYIHDYILQKCRGAQIRKVALFPQQKAVPSMPPTDPSCCLTTFREGKAPPPALPRAAGTAQAAHPPFPGATGSGKRVTGYVVLPPSPVPGREDHPSPLFPSAQHTARQDKLHQTKRLGLQGQL